MLDQAFLLALSPPLALGQHGRYGDKRVLLMHATFWEMFANRADSLQSSIIASDRARFVGLIDQLAEYLVSIEPKLNFNIGGPDPFRLSILYLPGAEQIAESFINNGTSPDSWEVSVELPECDLLESVHVEDECGDSLAVRYADLDAKVLPPKEGMVTIVCSLNTDFDPSGPCAHMYQAVAENVVFTLLGAWPQELAKVVLLPRSQTGNLLPLEQLRQQWIDIACGDRSP